VRRVLSKLPPGLVRGMGRLQFRYPALRWIVRRLDSRLTEAQGVIVHGVGAGLRFNATGGHPGYLIGTSEPLEQEMLRHHLQPGSVFYDVGANIGFFSTLAGRLVAPGGSVWAFEPFPSSAQRARENATLNGFAHVTVTEAAVGRECGRLTLALGKGSQEHRAASDGEGMQVDVVSIDAWRARVGAPAPTVVMIDAEGAELDVLEGMIGVLTEHRPVVACEVHWLGHDFDEFVEHRLSPLGYVLSSLDGTAHQGVERWHALLQPGPVAQAV
jgi:FkbM family methyltransferase